MSERERRALGSIEDGLAGSDPALASMLGIFSRLTSREEMSAAREDPGAAAGCPQPAPRPAARPHHGTALRRAHQLYLRLGWQQAMLLAWAVVSAGLIAVALVVNAGGHGACSPLMGTGVQRIGRLVTRPGCPRGRQGTIPRLAR